MRAITLPKVADEGGGIVIEITNFKDHNGSTVDPANITSVTWSLLDADDEIVNSRENVSVTPAASIEVGLVATDTTQQSTDNTDRGHFYRFFLVKWTYNTTINGSAVSNYPSTKEVAIMVRALRGVKEA